MPKFLIVANVKQNPLPIYDFAVPESLEVAVAPQTPEISKVPANFVRAAQNVENNVQELKDLGVKYCLVGHSYYRNNFGETNEIVEEKTRQLLEVGITPIICARNFEEIPTFDNFKFQISNFKFMVMFEPEYAISTNGQYHPETPEKILEVLTDWRAKLPNTRFLYGGSVNENFKFQISNFKLCSGLVVGHASLNPNEFLAIINQCASLKL